MGKQEKRKQAFDALGEKIEQLRAERDKLKGFCSEFVFGEDNPYEYQGEVTKLQDDVDRLRSAESYSGLIF